LRKAFENFGEERRLENDSVNEAMISKASAVRTGAQPTVVLSPAGDSDTTNLVNKKTFSAVSADLSVSIAPWLKSNACRRQLILREVVEVVICYYVCLIPISISSDSCPILRNVLKSVSDRNRLSAIFFEATCCSIGASQ
jgi:hypothetical protein